MGSFMKRMTWASIALQAWTITPLALVTDLYGLAIPNAMAISDITTNGAAFNASKIKGEISCDKMCGSLVEKTGFGEVSDKRVTGGAGSWTADDHQWCANHGEITDVGSQADAGKVTMSGASSGTNADGTTSTTSSLCPVPLGAGENCADVSKKILQCKFHNSELLNKCRAYSVATDGIGWQWILLALDVAAAAICTTTCVMAMSSAGLSEVGGWNQACQAAGYTSAVKEIVGMVFLNETFLHMVTGGVATAGTLTSTIANTATKVTYSGGTAMDGKYHSNADSIRNDAKVSCITAGFMAITAVIRGINIISMNSVKNSACEDIKKLAGDSLPTSGGGGGSYTDNGIPGSGSSSGPGTGGTAPGTTANGNPDSTQDGYSDAVENPPGSHAADGGALRDSGLSKLAEPLAQKLDKDEFLKGKSVAPMIASSMPASAGAMGAELAKIADTLEKNPELLPNVAGATYSGGGGGGGSSGGGSNAMAGLSSLFGGGGKDPTPASGAQTFGNRAPASDIWHTGTHMNLFEIVSGKIGVVTPRVAGR